MEYLVPCNRTQAYGADVTYGTNHEFGFEIGAVRGKGDFDFGPIWN